MSAWFKEDMVRRLGVFITNREMVRRRRAAGRAKPWTSDPILQRYRFTNVCREDDKVTRWVAEHIRQPFASHQYLWFMLCIARLINEPEVLADLMKGGGSWPNLGWKAEAFANVLRRRAKAGQKITTGVYMITTHGSEKPKPDYLAFNYLLPLWQTRNSMIEPQLAQREQTLASVHRLLSGYKGWGDFLTGQVIADLKHTRYLKHAEDWWDWAVLGPGSRRGLKRLEDDPRGHDDITVLVELRKLLRPVLAGLKLRLCLQDLQNCLCEFDKYERERLGEGHPRNRYDGLAA